MVHLKPKSELFKKMLLVWFMMGRNWRVSVLQLTGEESFMAGVAS